MRKALTVFLMLLVLLAGGSLGYLIQGHNFHLNFVQVVGKRAEFLLCPKGQQLNGDFDSQPGYATVTFTHNGRFAAAGHSCQASPENNSYYQAGYGYFGEGETYQYDKATNSLYMNFRPDLADLVVDKNSGGLYGRVRHSLAGTPVQVGQPQIGPATVLVSNTVGTVPVPAKAVAVDEQAPGEGQKFSIVLPENKIMPGDSGSPVLQVQNGRLYLVGAVSYLTEQSGGGPFASGSLVLANRVDTSGYED